MQVSHAVVRRWSALKSASNISRQEMIWGYIFVAPLLIGIFIFYGIPVLYSLFLSFTSWDGSSTMKFVGFENFSNLFKDSVYGESLRNTLVYTLVTVPVSLILSIILAVFLNSKIGGKVFYRTIYFLPSVTMTIAIAVVWKWIFNGDSGLLNYVLSLFHIHGPTWLSDPNFILISVMIVAVWGSLGYNMVILLAGLQSIPSTYYEAAAIDGAGRFRQFTRITIPLLSPSIFFLSIMSLIGSFQVFDLVFMMGPAATNGSNSVLMDSTRTVVYSIYENGFNWFKFGYASAQAWVLFIIILIITMIQFAFQKKWVHYEQ